MEENKAKNNFDLLLLKSRGKKLEISTTIKEGKEEKWCFFFFW